MGVSTKKKGVLKLVHPGRHVEIHREPITAAEIMSKYPRHCVARPDVFKFPYIVVRPESLLLPGKVFYLMPNRTLYNLLKARGQRSQPSLKENQYPRHHRFHGYSIQNSPTKCWEGITPICQHDQGHRRRLRNMLHDRTKSHDHDSEEEYRSDTSYVDAWTEIIEQTRKAPYRPHQNPPCDSSTDSCRLFHSKGCYYSGHNVTPTLCMVRRYNVTLTVPTVSYGGMWTRILGQRAKLKSCFKKQDSERKFLNLKVAFASPIVIPVRPGRSSSHEQNLWACNPYNLRL